MKKGFTLIELLAVIVILAIIALIAIPVIMNIIDDSKRNAAITSANGYVRAVNYKIAQEILNDRQVEDNDYVIGENSLVVTGNNIDRITGTYTVTNERVLWAGLCIDNYSVEYNAATGYTGISTRNFCGEEPYVFEEPEAELLSTACTDSTKYTSETTFKIKTVEDLVCLSNLVKSGSNFSGKTIYLLNDIDFNSDDSYSDKTTTAYGDINGNGTTEGLKTELTTSRGFKPIGNSTNKFSGTFLGYAFTIDHLMINRDTQYLGLFGYNIGTIKGVKLRNASVTSTCTSVSSAYVGGVVGYNKTPGVIDNADVKGTITATYSYVAGITGYNDGAVTNSIFSGTVTGNEYMGGIAGVHYTGSLSGAVYNSSISRKGGIITGRTGYTTLLVGFSSNSTIQQQETYYSGYGGYDGKILSTLTLEGVDGALDTYIGGDNDNDGYYFDYDSSGDITLYSTARTPIETNKLRGAGTEANPYLITNIDEWKLASATVTQGKYYSVTDDIDFTNKKYYALGTNTNKFNGNINGNMHTISNISLLGASYLGLFGIILEQSKDLYLII